MKLPKHKCGLYLEHNRHKDLYQNLGLYLSENESLVGDFASTESYWKAIETDELWTLQWYPDTPVGFCRVAAPTLEELLEMANEEES